MLVPRVLTLVLLLLFPIAAHAQLSMTVAGDPLAIKVRTWRDIPFRTVVRQQYDYSCGSAALATLLRYHFGRDVDEATIFKSMYLAGDEAVIRKVGFSLLDMKKYVEGSGMKADGYRASVEAVARDGLPVITVITIGQYKHFVVIKGVDRNTVLIGDPALGLRRMPRADFEKIWNGVVFVVHPDTGHAAPVFNDRREWAPWSKAPTGQELDRSTLLVMNVQIPVIYQVMQLTPLSPIL